jgi:hypothetical protein
MSPILAQTLGTLEVGKSADLLVLGADPHADRTASVARGIYLGLPQIPCRKERTLVFSPDGRVVPSYDFEAIL